MTEQEREALEDACLFVRLRIAELDDALTDLELVIARAEA